MDDAHLFLQKAAKELTGARLSKMFGADCIKAPNGKAVCLAWKGFMIFKLAGRAQEQALQLKGTHVFTPMEGRPMNGWIQVSVTHEKEWMALAKKSFELVSALVAAKPAKAKRR